MPAVDSIGHHRRADRHSRSAADDVPQSEPDGDHAQQDHGRAGRHLRSEGLTTKALEAHYLAGGNVPLVIRSMIAARKAKIIELDFKRATAIDLAGRNILEAVQTSVYPRVIDCPPRTASGRRSMPWPRTAFSSR